MKKTYVLDTNVLIHDPSSVFKFQENDIVIPLVVIEELDRLKKGHGEIAYSARHALKTIDGFREKGDLSSGVLLESGGMFRIKHVSGLSENSSADNRIIKTALQVLFECREGLSVVSAVRSGDAARYAYAEEEPFVILVSKDTAVRIKAESLGLHAEDYLNDKTAIFQQYGRVLSADDYTNGIRSARYLSLGDDVYRITGENTHTKTKSGKSLEGIEPKNMEQRCAIDALTNPEIEIVALTGSAGTGKTLLALAAGVHQTTKKSPLYEQVVVARPVVPMGNDLGYLPGDVEEKLAPWMQPIFDNLEVIVHTPKGQIKDNATASRYRSFQYLIDSGILEIEPLTYIRGRSLPRRYFIIDEAQNLRPLDVKTIITRCGEGTKIIFTGDLNQIDTPYLDAMSNGLAYLISCFIQEENFCYLNLKGSVRSRLAEQGAKLL
ncbi:MAG: PhoH family protein [Thermodesulfovibrionales bacterium]